MWFSLDQFIEKEKRGWGGLEAMLSSNSIDKKINKLFDIAKTHCPYDHRCETDSGLCGLIGVCPFTKGKAVSPKEFEKRKAEGDC